MKKLIFYSIFIFNLVLVGFGQDDLSVYIQQRSEINERSKALDNWIKSSESQIDRKSGLPKMKNYLTKAEKAKLAPPPEDIAKYAAFLKQKRTGIVKLLNTSVCSDKIIDVNNTKCLEAPQVVGQGSIYSFRKKSFLELNFIDIRLDGSKFSDWFPLTPVLFSELGDISLDKVDLNNEIAVLKNFFSVTETLKMSEKRRQFEKGIQIGNRQYKNNVPVKKDAAYLLASNRYDFFKRKFEQIIVAFKVVRVEENDSVVLIWKKL